MKDHLKDGHGLAIDHDVEHGVPQQIRQHIQQVHLAQEGEDYNVEHGYTSSIDSTSNRYT